jgi:hypothetical protein
MDHWAVITYATVLQGQRPKTVLLANDQACGTFALTGDVTIEDREHILAVRHRGVGWFDFEDARSRTQKPPN